MNDYFEPGEFAIFIGGPREQDNNPDVLRFIGAEVEVVAGPYVVFNVNTAEQLELYAVIYPSTVTGRALRQALRKLPPPDTKSSWMNSVWTPRKDLSRTPS